MITAGRPSLSESRPVCRLVARLGQCDGRDQLAHEGEPAGLGRLPGVQIPAAHIGPVHDLVAVGHGAQNLDRQRGLAGAQVDLMRGLVQDIACRGLLFGDEIVALSEVLLGHGDGAVRADREVADLYPGLGLDLEDGPGEVLALDVHLHQFQAGLLIVEENQLSNAISKINVIQGRD